MTTHLKKLILVASLLLSACGGPALINMNATADQSARESRNGVARLTVKNSSNTYEYSNAKTNFHYDADFDALEISIFGDDDTNSKTCLLYLVVDNASVWENGDTVSVAARTLFGDAALEPANSKSTAASFIDITSGSLQIGNICLNSTSCDNTGDYSLTFSKDGVTYTVTGTYNSDNLYLD
jgi:hypothetical protein